MAKVKVNKFNTCYWLLKKNEINEYKQVNNNNRKDIISIGRILYIIAKTGSNYLYRGSIVINPCFEKGYYKYPLMPWQWTNVTHFKINLDKTDKDDWARSYKTLIDGFIDEKALYYKKDDPILEFIKE